MNAFLYKMCAKTTLIYVRKILLFYMCSNGYVWWTKQAKLAQAKSFKLWLFAKLRMLWFLSFRYFFFLFGILFGVVRDAAPDGDGIVIITFPIFSLSIYIYIYYIYTGHMGRYSHILANIDINKSPIYENTANEIFFLFS